MSSCVGGGLVPADVVDAFEAFLGAMHMLVLSPIAMAKEVRNAASLNVFVCADLQIGGDADV